jgi:hypothetical protein
MAFVDRGLVHCQSFPLIGRQKRSFCLRAQPGDLGPIAPFSGLRIKRRELLHQQSSQLKRLRLIHGTQFAQPLYGSIPYTQFETGVRKLLADILQAGLRQSVVFGRHAFQSKNMRQVEYGMPSHHKR